MIQMKGRLTPSGLKRKTVLSLSCSIGDSKIQPGIDGIPRKHLSNVTAEWKGGSSHKSQDCSRRSLVTKMGTLMLISGYVSRPRIARSIPLAPLGKSTRTGSDKLTGLDPEEVSEILRRDISEGMYFVTGNLTREIFSDDCRFSDPTNDVSGLSRYLKALSILFDPGLSKVILKRIEVTSPNTIEADWVLGGWLRKEYFPWQPKVDPFEGHTVYVLNDAGIVEWQQQTWSVSALTALQQTFTPVWGPREPLL